MLASRLGLAALVLSGAACGHVPVTSMLKLSRIDPATTSPAEIRAAVKVPSALRVRNPELILTIKPGDGSRHERGFRLEESAEATQAAATEIKPKANERLTAYKIASSDLPKLSAFRTEILARRAGSSGTPEMSLSVKADSCREGELPGEAILLSTYLQTPEVGSYVPIVKDLDLRTLPRSRTAEAERSGSAVMCE